MINFNLQFRNNNTINIKRDFWSLWTFSINWNLIFFFSFPLNSLYKVLNFRVSLRLSIHLYKKKRESESLYHLLILFRVILNYSDSIINFHFSILIRIILKYKDDFIRNKYKYEIKRWLAFVFVWYCHHHHHRHKCPILYIK